MNPTDFPALFDPDNNRYYSLAGKTSFVVGRSQSADIPILDTQCSRRQFQITSNAGDYVIEAQSANCQTFLNAVALTEPHPIKHGGLIRAGSTTFVFLEREDSREMLRSVEDQPTVMASLTPYATKNQSKATQLDRYLKQPARTVWTELKAVFGAIITLTLKSIKFFQRRRQTKEASKIQQRADILLADAMLSEGVGDPAVIQKLKELLERITALQGTGQPTAPVNSEILAAKWKLANSESLGGSDRILKLRDERNSALSKLEQARLEELKGKSDIFSDSRAWYRAIAGISGCIVILYLFVGWLFSPTIIKGVSDEKLLSHACGFVVRGALIGDSKEIPGSTGSCFAITRDGYLLTNRHVIEGTEFDGLLRKQRIQFIPKTWVFFGKSEKYEAEIVYVSKNIDVAVLKIRATNLPVFRLSSKQEIPRGTKVYSCGFPGISTMSYGVNLAENVLEKQLNEGVFSFTFTDGIVNRMNSIENWEVIQHSADVNPGNSGGPLVDDNGIVVGINTLILNTDSGKVNFAILASQLKEEIEKHSGSLHWRN